MATKTRYEVIWLYQKDDEDDWKRTWCPRPGKLFDTMREAQAAVRWAAGPGTVTPLSMYAIREVEA